MKIGKNFFKEKIDQIKMSNKCLSYAMLTLVINSNSLLKDSLSKKLKNFILIIPIELLVPKDV
jgi:RNase P/RNase MRP subunit p30